MSYLSKNNQQLINISKYKSKVVLFSCMLSNFWLILKITRDLFAKSEKKESIQLYQHIYAYNKTLKNDKFNQKRNINKHKNENLLSCVVIASI